MVTLTGETLTEARGWLADCGWHDSDTAHAADVAAMVENNYAGGLPAFLAECARVGMLAAPSPVAQYMARQAFGGTGRGQYHCGHARPAGAGAWLAAETHRFASMCEDCAAGAILEGRSIQYMRTADSLLLTAPAAPSAFLPADFLR